VAAERQIPVPDIGEFEDVDVIEVLVAPGDRVVAEQSLITLESEKATMEIPSPCAGVVKALHVAVGDKVSAGSPILTLEVSDEDADATREQAAPSRPAAEPRAAEPAEPELALAEAGPAQMLSAAPPLAQRPAPGVIKAHASPSVRRLARELGVDLARVSGSGRKGRILKADIELYVKRALASGTQPPPPTGFAVPEMPEIDFSRWGEIEFQPLNKLRRVSARNNSTRRTSRSSRSSGARSSRRRSSGASSSRRSPS
jgi:pyruvate dehydrogenase E2 component (dihydrolipoamide acetyltransferase)